MFLGGVWWWCGGTLLGCRSTSSAPWWVLVVGSSWNIIEVRGLWVVGGVGGLLFVNYIVDASIFERRAWMTSLGLLVCGVYF